MDGPIWMRFSLNGCLPHWLKPYWNWWPWVNGQGHSDSMSIFSSYFSVSFSTVYLSSLMFDHSQGQNLILKVTDVEVSAFSECFLCFYTSTKSWRGYIFTPVCLCVCVYVFVCLCVRISCEQNSSRTDTPIWTQFLLNGSLQHWLGPYWSWWPWGQRSRSQWLNVHFFFIILC